MTDSEQNKTTAYNAAVNIAKLLKDECSSLMTLYKQREHFINDLVGKTYPSRFPSPSSQLNPQQKLRGLHLDLHKCHTSLERATRDEEKRLGGGEEGEYENLKKRVKDRLSALLRHIEELLKPDGVASRLTPRLLPSELDDPKNLFQLKCRVYDIYQEVHHLSQVAITTLNDQQV